MPFQFLRVGELVAGRIREDGFVQTPLRDKVRDVQLVGLITGRKDDKNQEVPPSFTFLSLEDGSGKIQIRAFGKEKKELVEDIGRGDSILVKGEVDIHEDLFYVRPRIVRQLSFAEEVYYRFRVVLDYLLRFREKEHGD